jgi:MFS transporter, PPP family, 3-phenylpropionic acid transporter
VKLPYWRLSLFFFAYFIYVGTFTPYWSLYLKSQHLDALQIAVLMSLFQFARIFSPGFWGWVADNFAKRMRVIHWLTGLSFISFIPVFFGSSYSWLFTTMLILSSFASASLPIADTVVLSHLGGAFELYGKVRMWGSIGFIFAVTGVGYLLDIFSTHLLLWILFASLLVTNLLSYFIAEPESHPSHLQAEGSIWQILIKREVIALFSACFMMAAAHGAYYTFFTIYLVDHGYSKGNIGWIWSLGVIAEILIFLWMPVLMRRFGLMRIMVFSLFMGFIRFNLIGWAVDSVLIILLAQLLHAATFGSYHASAVSLTHHYFKGQHQSKGQGLYTTFSYGMGGTLGCILSGYLWKTVGSTWTFSISGLFALLGYLLFSLMMFNKTSTPIHAPK